MTDQQIRVYVPATVALLEEEFEGFGDGEEEAAEKVEEGLFVGDGETECLVPSFNENTETYESVLLREVHGKVNSYAP